MVKDICPRYWGYFEFVYLEKLKLFLRYLTFISWTKLFGWVKIFKSYLAWYCIGVLCPSNFQTPFSFRPTNLVPSYRVDTYIYVLIPKKFQYILSISLPKYLGSLCKAQAKFESSEILVLPPSILSYEGILYRKYWCKTLSTSLILS